MPRIRLRLTIDRVDIPGWTGTMPADSEHAQRTVLPLACTLGPDDGLARVVRWRALRESAAPVTRLLDGQLEVHYRSAPGVQEELQDLAAAEQVCCSFVTWVVSNDHGQPVLRVISPADSPEALGPIAGMFGIPFSTETASH
jgi:hypothetical protein